MKNVFEAVSNFIKAKVGQYASGRNYVMAEASSDLITTWQGPSLAEVLLIHVDFRTG